MLLPKRADRSKIEFSREQLLGFNYQAFASIDERTKSQLSGLLTPEQMKTLPTRHRLLAKGGKDDRPKAAGK